MKGENFKMKKTIIVGLLIMALVAFAAGCGRTANDQITVVSREDGSGTRGAFIELFNIEEKDADGNKVDHTTVDADITNSTSVMMTSVAGNAKAIGYISLGSLNDSVKAVMIDGAEATVENIKSGTYKVSRPFNIATKGTVYDATQAFIDFILSSEGQAVVEENGYISAGNNGAFSGKAISGKVVVVGSSSIAPVMEKLKETCISLLIQMRKSRYSRTVDNWYELSKEGICDIGMASRELKDSEGAGLTPIVMAMDGIAVIVNNENAVSGL